MYLKWSRDWYQNANILKNWLHNFCPNLISTIDFKELLFQGRLFVEGSNLANVKLKYCSPHFRNGLATDIKILIFWISSDFDTFCQGFIWFGFAKGVQLVFWLIIHISLTLKMLNIFSWIFNWRKVTLNLDSIWKNITFSIFNLFQV